MNKEQIARLKELAEMATPGPWELGTFYDVYAADDWLVAECDKYGKNAAFIAAANPAAILELISENERLKNDRQIHLGAFGNLVAESDPLRKALGLPEDVLFHEVIQCAVEKLARLEKEADWLAAQCAELDRDLHSEFGIGPYIETDWKAEARKAAQEAS